MLTISILGSDLVVGCTIRALTITYTSLEVPYYSYSIMGPETLFFLLRPL